MLVLKKKKTYSNFILILIAFAVFGFFASFLSKSPIFSIAFSLFIFGFFLFQDLDKCFSILLFFLPLQGIFDSSNFLYFINILGGLYFVKLIFIYKKFHPIFLLILFLYLYNFLLLIINFTDFSSIISATSFFVSISSLVLSALLKDKINFTAKRNFYLFFFGCLLSGLFSYINLFSEYGFSMSIRLVSLARDANYFALYCLCGFFFANYFLGTDAYSSSKTYFRICKYLFLILGLLTTSKMFLLMLCLGLVISFFISKHRFTRKKIAIAMSLIMIGAIIATSLGIFNFFIERYIGRIDFSDITTGRSDISLAFLSAQFSDVGRAIFGVGTNYSNVYNIVYNAEHMSCHLAYQEMLLSFGMFGSILFIWLILWAISIFFNSTTIRLNASFLVLGIFLLCCFALPLFTNDAFWLFFSFILGFMYENNNYVIKRAKIRGKIYAYKCKVIA